MPQLRSHTYEKRLRYRALNLSKHRSFEEGSKPGRGWLKHQRVTGYKEVAKRFKFDIWIFAVLWIVAHRPSTRQHTINAGPESFSER